MSIRVVDDRQETESSTDSSGKDTVRRFIIYETDSNTRTTDIVTSTYYPQLKSAMPDSSSFKLDSRSLQKLGDTPPRWMATLTYARGGDVSGEYKFNEGDTPPWELDAQDFQTNWIEAEVPFDSGWDKDWEKKDIRNSAGSRILASRKIYILNITFNYNIRNTKDIILNDTAVLNKRKEKVAGVGIEAYAGLLMPISTHHYTVYESDGETVKWEYLNCNVSILIHPEGWMRSFLDVGNIARFKNKENKLVLGAIYRYFPWTSKNDSENLKTLPKYGSINDVIAARDAYEKIGGEWLKLPYEEVTEPMPLNEDGTIFEDAILGVDNNLAELPEYRRLKFYDTKAVSWKGYNLPAKR